VVSFGDFSLHEQRKVTRSAEGRVEALHLQVTRAAKRHGSSALGHEQRKVTRSAKGRVEATALKKQIKMDYTRLLPRALRAIRCANVRSGILPSQSRVRGNDGQRKLADTQKFGLSGQA
jgi:hypothetical protein